MINNLKHFNFRYLFSQLFQELNSHCRQLKFSVEKIVFEKLTGKCNKLEKKQMTLDAIQPKVLQVQSDHCSDPYVCI